MTVQECCTGPEMTVQERFEQAVKDARATGVKVRQNVQECCRGCIGPEKLGLMHPDAGEFVPHAYTYGGQGFRTRWTANGQTLEYPTGGRWGRREVAEDVAWNHGGPGVYAAERIAEAFKAQGFEVDWDGTESTCVIVKLPKVEG